MSTPVVSVIMPAYNAGEFIQESIESVINQTYTSWELLIVDDGSTDNTKTIIEKFCERDERIKYYYQQNGKQGKARNLAFKHAQANFIAFLDADDIWLPQKLEMQLKELQEKKVDLVFCESYLFSGSLVNAKKIMQSGKGLYEGDAALKDFLQQNKIPTLTVLMRAEVLENVEGFSENAIIQNAEDYHLWLRLLLNGNTLYGSYEVLAAYREHPASSTTADKLAVSKAIEVLEDLKLQFPQYASMMNLYLKQWFRRYHELTNPAKENYKNLIKKNCNYIDRPRYKFFFQLIYSFLGFNTTKKLMNKIINNSAAF